MYKRICSIYKEFGFFLKIKLERGPGNIGFQWGHRTFWCQCRQRPEWCSSSSGLVTFSDKKEDLRENNTKFLFERGNLVVYTYVFALFEIERRRMHWVLTKKIRLIILYLFWTSEILNWRIDENMQVESSFIVWFFFQLL